MSLLGPNGSPISSEEYAKPKVKSKVKPKIGELAVGFGEELYSALRFNPTPNSLQFDTSKLTLADYRLMLDHYQVNSSLCLLTFMIHQAQWRIKCDDQKVADHCEMNLKRVWTRLIRAMSQAFWAGYSPNALQWENDEIEGKVMLTKIKDLRPEECMPKWKKVPAVGGGATVLDPAGYSGETDNGSSTSSQRSYTKIFDGIKQIGFRDIPVTNSFWYACIQQEGNMYGKKLLNAAFQPWFFSLLIHMYANRYFERFGEPTIVARAPYDDTVDISGEEVKGNVLMQHFARMLRNGAVPVLPNGLQQSGLSDSKTFEYSLEYLESQMRGADFDRYIAMLDQEISLALFTPVLMTQTGAGGSFNLGVTHTNVYMHQLNAILADMKEYIDRYIIEPMALYNFGEKHKHVEIEFRRFGGVDPETARMVINSMIGGGKLKLSDVVEVGQELGMSVEEVEEIAAPPGAIDPKTGEPINPDDDTLRPGDPNYDPTQDPNNPVKGNPKTAAPKGGTGKPKDTRQGRPERTKAPKGTNKKGKVSTGMAARLAQQLLAGRETPDVGFKAQYADWVTSDLFDGFGGGSTVDNNYPILTGIIDRAFDSAREVELENEPQEVIEDFFTKSILYHMDHLEMAISA